MLFEMDANGLEKALPPKVVVEVVEDEFRLANGLLGATVVCDCVPKGFKATPAGAAMAAANGLLMVVSLLDMLEFPKGLPLFDDDGPSALVAFGEPKVEKLEG